MENKNSNALKNLRGDLRRMANPEKAKGAQRYFKTGKGEYAEGDIFLGLTSRQIQDIVKKYSSLPLNEIEKLLRSRIHCQRMCALRILRKQFGALDKALMINPLSCEALAGRDKIFDLYLANTKFINNWDLVDISAPHIVGAYLQNKDKKILFELAKSKSLWERRIAMLATFRFIKNGDCQVAFQIVQVLLGDKEDLIHKAVGWMLREIGKNCGQEILEEFLQKHYKNMSRTTLRYAIEHFDEGRRQYYLNLK